MDLDYDPKRKDPRRTRQARQRLAAGVGAVLLLVLLLATRRRGKAVVPAPAPPKAASDGGGQQQQQQPAAGGENKEGGAPSRFSLLERMSKLTPMYRGPGKIETLPGFANANRLLLATHNRLMWYRYDTDELRVIHEGKGVYYGAFTGEGRDALGAPSDLWVVSRPHNWHPKSSKEYLLHLSLETGKELGRVEVPSRFTHDAVRRRDKVYVCSTGTGAILQLAFPSMELEKELKLFTPAEHVNTLGPTPDGKLWALLHNLGKSVLAEVDLGSGDITRHVEGVGTKSHGLVFWDRFILVLDSEGGALLQVDTHKEYSVGTAWQLNDSRFYLKGLAVVDDIAFFGIAPHTQREDRADPTLNCHLAAFDLKSNTLLWTRRLPTHGLLNIVAAPHLAVESTAYSMNTAALVNYRTKPEFEALLERAKGMPSAPLAAEPGGPLAGKGGVLAGGVQRGAAGAQHGEGAGGIARRQAREEGVGQAPHLGVGNFVTQAQHRQAGEQQQQQVAAPSQKKLSLSETEYLPASDPLAKYPPRIGGHWSSGWPRMELSAKALPGFEAGLQLLLFRTDVSKLKEALLSLPAADWTDEEQARRNAFLTGRSANLGAVKPGARSIMLQFSDHDGEQVARFPWYYRFQPLVEPLLKQVLGEADLSKIIRLQLAYMAPHTQIKIHRDQGRYASHAHRIHLVVATDPQVVFAQCPDRADAQLDVAASAASILQGQLGADGCLPIHVTQEGLVFELNNRLRHYVVNGGDEPRIHLLVDVAETPRKPFDLRMGQTCDYSHGRIDC